MSDRIKSLLFAAAASLTWLAFYLGAHAWFFYRAGAL